MYVECREIGRGNGGLSPTPKRKGKWGVVPVDSFFNISIYSKRKRVSLLSKKYDANLVKDSKVAWSVA